MPNPTQLDDSRAWTRRDLVLLVVTTSICALGVLDANMVALSLPSTACCPRIRRFDPRSI